MSYHVSLKTINDTKSTSSVIYTEEDLINFLVKLKDGFAIFEGKILNSGYSDLSDLQIIEKNYDGIDGENNPAIFFPFPVDGIMTYDNKAGTYQSVYETGGDFDPYEVDITEEYVRKYIIENQKPYIVESCRYNSNTGKLNINTIDISFKKYSNNTLILDYMSQIKKNELISFGEITENKIGNDSLADDASFYSTREQINKRIYEKVPIKEFLGLGLKAFYCQYLGK